MTKNFNAQQNSLRAKSNKTAGMPELELFKKEKEKTMKKRKFFAFTLAEVLITLTIIGVIAAMTIPTLMQNYQKHQTVTKLKAAYSLFSQAFNMAAAEHGDIKNWSEDLSRIDSSTERVQYFYDNYLKPYMKIEKSCNPSSDECWKDSVSLSGIGGYLKSPGIASHVACMSLILSNGMTAYLWTADNGTHVQIWVNVNGHNNKAVLGKDIFGFRLSFPGDGDKTVHGFLITGQWKETDDLINDSSYGCNRDVQTMYAGWFCTELIRRSGWKIDDNYPW